MPKYPNISCLQGLIKHQFSCLTPSPTMRKARAEMLQPTNGRESQAPAATLQWGPHGITPMAQPQGECWISIQHIPNGKSWDPKPFLESSHPKPFLKSSPVIEQSWPPEGAQAGRVRAATHITGDSASRGSLLASLNIRTLTDAKLRIIFEWMQMSGVVEHTLLHSYDPDKAGRSRPRVTLLCTVCGSH